MSIVTADIVDGKIYVTFPYDHATKEAVKSVPGSRFVPPGKPGGPAWSFPLDIKSGRGLREALGDRLVLSEELRSWGVAENKKATQLRSMVTATDADLERLPQVLPELCKLIQGDPLPWHPNKELRKKRKDRTYQRADISFMAAHDCINANQPGLGKTIEVIGAVFESDLSVGSHLVITPKTSLRVTWERELKTWQPYPVFVYDTSLSSSARSEMLSRCHSMHESGEPFWFLTNPAMLRMKQTQTGVDVFGDPEYDVTPVTPEIYRLEWSTMTVDEYHKMGLTNTKTLTSRGISKIRRKRTWLLSGTPMGGKPVKLFSGLQFIAPEVFSSKWRWADQWLVISDNGYGKKIEGLKPDSEEEFYDYHSRFMIRRTKSEVLPELPEKQHVDVWCEMTERQSAQYAQVAVDAELRIDEEKLSITSILAEYTRLRQFSDAYQNVSKSPAGKPVLTATEDSGKLPQLLKIMEGLGIAGDDRCGDEQLIVFSQFSGIVEMVTHWIRKMGVSAEMITGGVSQAERERIAESFQRGDGARVLCMTTTAGGTGLTLDRASTVVFMDETWDPDDQEQGADRVHRASRIHQVTIYTLRSVGSIDEYVQELVGQKMDTNVKILDLHRMLSSKHSSGGRG